jgi:hypothetical protein
MGLYGLAAVELIFSTSAVAAAAVLSAWRNGCRPEIGHSQARDFHLGAMSAACNRGHPFPPIGAQRSRAACDVFSSGRRILSVQEPSAQFAPTSGPFKTHHSEGGKFPSGCKVISSNPTPSYNGMFAIKRNSSLVAVNTGPNSKQALWQQACATPAVCT